MADAALPASRAAARPRLDERARVALAIAAVATAVLAAWEWLPPALGAPRYIWPTVSDMAAEMGRMAERENLARHFISTAWTATVGFLLGSAFGAAIGYLIGMSRFLERVLSPYLLGLQIAPKVAFAPLFIMWFGYTFWPKLLVTVLIVFFPILVNVAQAVRTADRDYLNLARAYSFDRVRIFRTILFPMSLPALFAGLKIGATLAVIGVTVGELVGGNVGLGFLIVYAEGQANTAMVFNAILLLTVIGIALYWAVGAVERRALHWT